MSKQATIASLVRIAAKTEPEFVETIEAVFEEGIVERIHEFFDRLNIPRSQTTDMDLLQPIPDITAESSLVVVDYESEALISSGMQRFVDRHVRKVKWHAGHPSIEGIKNVLMLFRVVIVVTNLRLGRLARLLALKPELSPTEWAIARKLMNDTFISFRNFLDLAASDWVDSLQQIAEEGEIAAELGNFYSLVDMNVKRLDVHKEKLEELRRDLAVLPEGFLPVKPPIYFHGDLLGKGPWKLYWSSVNSRAHHFREAIN